MLVLTGIFILFIILDIIAFHYYKQFKKQNILAAFMTVNLVNLSVLYGLVTYLIGNTPMPHILICSCIASTTIFLIIMPFVIRNATKESFTITVVFLLELFVQVILVYANIYTSNIALFSRRISHIDALYYSITTFTTTGYGDIVPVEPLSKIIAASEMVIGYLFVGFIIAVLVAKFIQIQSE